MKNSFVIFLVLFSIQAIAQQHGGGCCSKDMKPEDILQEENLIESGLLTKKVTQKSYAEYISEGGKAAVGLDKSITPFLNSCYNHQLKMLDKTILVVEFYNKLRNKNFTSLEEVLVAISLEENIKFLSKDNAVSVARIKQMCNQDKKFASKVREHFGPMKSPSDYIKGVLSLQAEYDVMKDWACPQYKENDDDKNIYKLLDTISQYLAENSGE